MPPSLRIPAILVPLWAWHQSPTFSSTRSWTTTQRTQNGSTEIDSSSRKFVCLIAVPFISCQITIQICCRFDEVLQSPAVWKLCLLESIQWEWGSTVIGFAVSNSLIQKSRHFCWCINVTFIGKKNFMLTPPPVTDMAACFNMPSSTFAATRSLWMISRRSE